MATRISTLEALEQTSGTLRPLVDHDPAEAIARARSISGKGKLRPYVHHLRATVLIDAGTRLGDESALREGIRLLRQVMPKAGNKADLGYNIASAFDALACTADWRSPQAYVDTHEYRKESRNLYFEAARSSDDRGVKGRAWTNLGNSLDRAARWAEAYDCWVRALHEDPTNGVPALCIMQMFSRRSRHFPHHPGIQHRLARYYARYAKRHAREIDRHAGKAAGDLARRLNTRGSSWKPRQQIGDEYARFVAQHRLGLVATIEGVDFGKKRWDDVEIHRVSESLDREGVPPVFAMVNQLKADFGTARWLAFVADSLPGFDGRHPIPRTASFRDTLDYAVYGTIPSTLVLAQRAAMDILDRVAVCANNFFEFGERPTRVAFGALWRTGCVGAWRSPLAPELSKWNWGIIALGDLAADLNEGGWLASHGRTRNAGTHRFSVLHDESIGRSRKCSSIDHYDLSEFFRDTLTALSVARSAILYLLDAIEWHEASRPRPELSFATEVVPHHYIRGEHY